MSDDLVSVMVPKQHLQAVYGFLAKLGDSDSGKRPDPAGGGGDDFDEWTNSRLERMVSESGRAMRDIFRALCSRPDEWISTQELAEALRHKPKANWNTIAGTLGAFGKRLSSRYEISTWPMAWRREPDGKGMRYMMPSHMAKRIRPLLDAK